ncbi:GAP family protein [Janibacter cremeus]|uniref:Sap, sulfolipid-1-addressing protein n=1 Tax=Janibacter cremeus TaxID=1285192 RepID=A0A852VSS8_9MICO|nr:GAP family protein [Janibacter cremeus]NYF98958.1 hypothetical protein [Janibacter cremeus]
MELTLGGLVVLALIDSTSAGTLGIPVWMLARQRIRVRAVLGYLATITLFYWLLGVALLLGLDALGRAVGHLGNNPVVLWGQLVLGAGLLAVSFLFDEKPAARRRARREARGRGRTRVERLKDTVVGEGATTRAVVVLALVAGVIEAASMLPYLAAMGLLINSGLALTPQLAALVGYVVVMIAPALLLLALRVTLARTVEPLLGRLNAWFASRSDAMIGWVLGIVGVLLALDAADRLQLFG